MSKAWGVLWGMVISWKGMSKSLRRVNEKIAATMNIEGNNQKTV